jgi:hypothetical protein
VLTKRLAVWVLAVVVVPMLLWAGQRWLDAKDLSLSVVTENQLVVSGADKDPEIQIAVNGASLESPYVTYIRAVNNGGQPLSADDFKTPVSLRLKSTTKLEYARVVAQYPKDLNLQITKLKDGISFRPELLNKGDAFQIMLVTTGERPQFTADGRLVGVSELRVVAGPAFSIALIWPFLEFLAFALLLSCSLLLIPNGANEPMLLTIRARLFVGLCSMGSAVVFGITTVLSHGVKDPDAALNWYMVACAVSYLIYRVLKKSFHPVENIRM